MAHGLPVITSDAPGLVELISGQKYGLSFTNNDTNDLSEKIKRLHYDRSLLEKFSLLSLNRSKDFDILKIVKEYDMLYQ